MQTLIVNNVEIQVERKPIKNLHLSVYPPDGRVHVSAPLTYTDEEIAVLEAKRAKYEQVKQRMMQELLRGRIRLINN